MGRKSDIVYLFFGDKGDVRLVNALEVEFIVVEVSNPLEYVIPHYIPIYLKEFYRESVRTDALSLDSVNTACLTSRRVIGSMSARR
jgi:hypothetical protein